MPDHEPAHRVADERELVERDRPVGDELLEQLAERLAVGLDAQAAVVAQPQRRPALLAQGRGVGRLVALGSEVPAALGLAQAVHEHDGAARRRKRVHGIAQLHRDRGRVADLGQAVADKRVDPGTNRQSAVAAQQRRRGEDGAPDAEAHAGVDGRGNQVVRGPGGAGRGAAGNRQVRLLDRRDQRVVGDCGQRGGAHRPRDFHKTPAVHQRCPRAMRHSTGMAARARTTGGT